MIKNLIQKIENMPMSFWQGIITLYIIFILRTIIETFTNIALDGSIASLFAILFVQPFWFYCAFLTLFIILKLITKEKIEKISKFGIIISPLIFIPPIIDFAIKGPLSSYYVFVQGTFTELLYFYTTFFSRTGLMISTGMKVAILVLFILSGSYILSKTMSWKKTFLGIILIYTIFSFYGAIPTYIFAGYNLIFKDYTEVNRSNETDFYFARDILKSNTKNKTIILSDNLEKTEASQRINIHFYLILAPILWIINLFLLSIWVILYDREKAEAIFKNFRYLRLILYFSLVLIGILLGNIYNRGNPINSLFDITALFSMYLAILFAGLFSIWENDEIDIEIDKISNKERPLPKEKFSIKEWRDIKYLFLILSLCFSILSSYYTFIFILAFIFIYHIYSAPPLRLKKIPILSSFLIGLLTLISVWIGFFFSSGTEKLLDFPLKYSFSIFGFFLLLENFKNIKDIKGDREAKINTLPVLIGENRGKFIVGLLAWISPFLIIFGFLFNLYTLLTAFIFGFIIFLLINKKNYKEKYIFFAIYLFIISFAVEFYLFSQRI
ncbi:MAG: UbiA family prenyltransferase [Parcubacteria group bacterium]|nr:UbiA family prenyltransferase [Parcubacteria group bacterium]MCR4342739.1 UbiA family prenyltransferase [Patescibacteria group bacterium]